MLNSSQEFAPGLLHGFLEGLRDGDPIGQLSDGLIGKNAMIDGPFGPKPLVYADYVASGRALRQVEQFVMDEVLPFYANSHTEASHCGAFMTRLRAEARATISQLCGAGPDHAVIFTGSGATAGINRLCALFGVGPGSVVITGPYEHHSNLLPWRETGAEVIAVAEAQGGGPDLDAFAAELAAAQGRHIVCAFSAASNVNGILTEIAPVTRMAKAAGARMIWDYAGGGPYLPIAMTPEPDCVIDAIVVSPHKFIGGPGASGVLILRRDAVVTARPTWPGGGTVSFVSDRFHDYSDRLEAREEAGTPNVIGDIRAALAFLVKQAISPARMQQMNASLARRAKDRWSGVERLELLGHAEAARLPIFAFRIGDGAGGHVHQQLVTRLLSDRYGIQARGGCACAGPYVHHLLGISAAESDSLRSAILRGEEVMKPGFTRLNFSVLMREDTVDYILDSVAELAGDAADLAAGYRVDPARAIFSPCPDQAGSVLDMVS
ncbi:Selenocysteine lyase/Cysteine desulfurase [Paracoccus isoporae]|uniref:Selenocysteine lyase/Cysteine desulfurase n=1 Tax=Paracoccus isoporae TaxID=591205 RepID=A0A1G7DBK8_9RHOB|nr:aminotransferase class V-fold PLP-dependent enzyme [Paracoccus isoporae]SDE48306.1 Selenocysteine lyase/Cysteine desulfurase [Paracoccus isoporae]